MFSCLSWLPSLWNQIFFPEIRSPPKVYLEPLPDEIIINILSRLPAEDVLGCRKVSELWKSLTSTKTFAQIHRQRTVPTVIIQLQFYKQPMDLFLLDDCKEKKIIKKKKKKRKDEDEEETTKEVAKKFPVSSIPLLKQSAYPKLRLSYHGFLLLSEMKYHSSSRFSVVFNPVTQEKLEIMTPGGTIMALFQHPISKNYFAIWEAEFNNQYKIFSLESTGPWRSLGSFPYQAFRRPPVIFQGSIYCMVQYHYIGGEDGMQEETPACEECIMVFDMEKEEFSSIPHPGQSCEVEFKEQRHEQMHLMEVDGNLSLLRCSGRGPFWMEIWVMEDGNNRLWIKRHSLMVKLWDEGISSTYKLRPLGIVNEDDLLVTLHSKQELFAVNLKSGNMVKKLGREVDVDGRWMSKSSMSLHTSSLVCLSS